MKKQIIVKPGIFQELTGKVVRECAYNIDYQYSDMNQIIITFTDGTFIAFGIERDDDSDDFILVNNHFPPLECYSSYPPHVIDSESGQIKFDRYIQQQIDLGVVGPMSQERLEQLVEDHYKKERERDYQQYLRLKKMFEKEETK